MSNQKINLKMLAGRYATSVAMGIGSALFTWGVGLFIEKCKRDIYNKLIKKPFCPICGGSKYVVSSTITSDENIISSNKPCPRCNNKKLSRYAEVPIEKSKYYRELKFRDMLTYKTRLTDVLVFETQKELDQDSGILYSPYIIGGGVDKEK